MQDDVIIIGAGLAGAAAALKLKENGIESVVLEACDRIGGRAYARPYAGADYSAEPLEYGGSWIKSGHHRIKALTRAFGLSLRPRHPVIMRLALQNGDVRPLMFTSAEARLAHDIALARVAMDGALVKQGHTYDEAGRPIVAISYADYMARINPPRTTRDLFDAYWIVSGGGPQGSVSAAEFLSSCGDADGLAEHMIDKWEATVAPGMDVLAQRMFEASDARLALNSFVTSIDQSQAGVTVTVAKGETHNARVAIVALGVNQMNAVHFSPAPPRQDTMLRGHDGKAFKLWVKARGITPGTVVTGSGEGISYLFAERMAADGTTLCICFGLQACEARPGDADWVRECFARLVPNAAFISYDWHDWINDPFARGTWLSTPYDHGEGFDASNWMPFQRIAFASSDIAAEQAGWFEGAVRSGEAAALWAASTIQKSSP
jgi:monoamine oxidase